MAIAVLALAAGLYAVWIHPSGEAPPASGDAKPAPPPPAARRRAPPTAPPAVPYEPGPPPPEKVAEMWKRATLARDRNALNQLELEMSEKPDLYIPHLTALAAGDADPHVRAFSISAMGRFPKTPPEEFFIKALGEDPHEYPREAAAAALDLKGTAKCLPALERAAASDPAEGVRRMASRAAQAVKRRS